MKRFLSVFMILLLMTVFSASAVQKDDGYIDQYVKGYFSKKYPVYSGPGEQYYRASDGKAQYGSGAIRYYGTCPEGWLLIGYSVKKTSFRMGYIKAPFKGLVAKGKEERVLSFTKSDSVTLKPLEFFDDPGIGKIASLPLMELPKNAQVTYLGPFNQDWDYVEIDASYLGSPSRGFVKSGNMAIVAAGPGSPGASSLQADGETSLKWDTTYMAWLRNVDILSGTNWKAVPNVPWIVLSAENNTLKIQLQANEDQADRKGTINLSNGVAVARIIVVQGGKQK